jgi:VWFA-related protein
MKDTIRERGAKRGLRLTAIVSCLAVLLIALLGANALVGGQDQTKTTQDQTKSTPEQAKTTPSQTNTTPEQAKPATDQTKTAPDKPKITVESKVVTVFATVRDKHGQIVATLTKDDFAVDEDGRPQTISYFARENDLPLTTGLLVDTSRSQTRVLDQEVDASYTFLDHVLREKDKAFIIHFDHEVELLTDLTSSRQKLDAGLKAIKAPQLADASDKGSHHSGGGTLLYDAVYLASEELMKKQQGRKALIILSDGVDRGSKESLHSAIESAQRANTVVYSILFKGEEPGQHGGYGGGGYGGGGYGGHGGGGRNRYPQQEQRPDGKKILERISKETGGRLVEVSKKETVDKIYAEIEQELREQYVLGYAPDKSQTGASYRKIHLTTKQKDLTVQARDGYYAE